MRNRLRTGFAGPQKEWVEAPTPPFNRRRSLVSTRRRMPRSSDSLSRHGDNARNPGAAKRPRHSAPQTRPSTELGRAAVGGQGDEPAVPSLWATKKSAERWLAKNPPEPYRDIIRVWGLLNTYRPPGQTSWSKALARHGADAGVALAGCWGDGGGNSCSRSPHLAPFGTQW
jgi:hypothetical protein